jgi:hypothetical protein
MKSAPAGQLGGRAGRKCTLEDGERFLLRSIEVAHLYLVIVMMFLNTLPLSKRMSIDACLLI